MQMCATGRSGSCRPHGLKPPRGAAAGLLLGAAQDRPGATHNTRYPPARPRHSGELYRSGMRQPPPDRRVRRQIPCASVPGSGLWCVGWGGRGQVHHGSGLARILRRAAGIMAGAAGTSATSLPFFFIHKASDHCGCSGGWLPQARKGCVGRSIRARMRGVPEHARVIWVSCTICTTTGA